LEISSSQNQQIADAIAERLHQARQIRHYQVDISCQDGTVELTGQVADLAQRGEILRIVQGVAGVQQIVDHLSIGCQAAVKPVQAESQPPAQPPLIFQPGPAPKSDGPPKGQVNTEPTQPPLIFQPGPAPKGEGPPKGQNNTEPTPIFQAPPGPQPGMMPPRMPPYAWPAYAPYNNFSRVAYPNLYPYQSWPFIGPFYPYPKIPPGWRSITLSWQDGYWWYGKNATPHDWWRVRYW
jgi:hypothetical protein